MRLPSRRTLVLAIALLVAGCGRNETSSATASIANTEWKAYGGDLANTKYTPLAQIDAENVKKLRVAWRWSSPDNDIVAKSPKGHAPHVSLFEGTPVSFNGNLYVSTGLHQVASLDARTGKTRWVYNPEIYERGAPQRIGFSHRGVALWPAGSRVFFASGEGYLTALDLATGNPIPEFGKNGSIDLIEGLRRPARRFEFGVNGPPIVVGDIVIVGSFIQDGWTTKEGPPGDVRGYDARTGKLVWTFHTIPDAGEEGVETWLEDSWKYSGSANVWAVMSADEELGYVYLPTSTPTNDHYGGHRPGDNLFAESIVCLDARTGKRVWHFQTTHHGVWDYDLPTAPVLANVTIDGKLRKILAQPSKQAFLYVLDRETGKPIWPIVEQPVSQSKAPGERSAATQPIPSRPAPFDRQGFAIDELIDFTPELRAEATRILNQFEFGPVYYPPSERGTAVLPGAVGGASWSGAGIDPETGWIYIPSITNPQVMRLAKPKPDESDMRYVSLGANRFALNGPEGLPITKPPYGRITAIDLGSGDHRWVAPLGSGPRDHARLKALNLQPLGWPSRGFVLVTKTLLFAAQEPAIKQQLNTETNVFEKTGTTREPMLRAFDKRTGQMLADFELPANAGGSPMAFGAGDREFIVVPVGGGGIPAELIALTIGE